MSGSKPVMDRRVLAAGVGAVLFEVAQPSDRVVAFGLAVTISAVFAIAAVFAAVPLVRIPAFIPLHESAVIINDLLTGAGFAMLFCAPWRAGVVVPRRRLSVDGVVSGGAFAELPRAPHADRAVGGAADGGLALYRLA